ncbi:alpha/beta hydrolase [Winogradskyella schleiferi]|uniref:alpha/beta hydrolase n=1 Tax=Winogradskyella schleiferi TaxID=2686078 RepID=UPI0015B8D6B8|nr:alpha/beta hydrolase-fold protein [Winogradskyella schleiferi]
MKYKFLFVSILFCLIARSQEANYHKELKYLQDNGLEPSEYIINKFGDKSLILLGEDHVVKNNLNFVAQIIPKLYKAGVYNIGMEFGAYEKQKELDNLILGENFDAQVSRDLMFFYNVGWPYQEYQDILKAAWAFNNTLPENSKKFRIVNISYQYDWTAYNGSREDMSGVFHKGEVNQFRKEVIINEILEKGEKGLILCGLPHAFTKYSQGVKDAKGNCTYRSVSLGNLLLDKYKDQVFSIFLHGPIYNFPNESPFFLSPANGEIENVFKLMSNEPLGFDLGKSPIGKLKEDSWFSNCYNDFTIGDLFDGYIFLVPFQKMEDCTIDEDFFKNKSWNEIKKQIPDPYWHKPYDTKKQYWEATIAKIKLKERYKDITRIPNLTVTYGKVDRVKNFQSNYVDSRNIDVWLPPNYNDSERCAVLYMHDGQMLFDSTRTWNNQEWKVDETIARLIFDGKIRNTIVVGVWNNGAYRHSEYFPQKPISYLDRELKGNLIKTDLKRKQQADNYLKFLVEELKPYIDKNYSTHTNVQNTFIAGSSMGGLISMYAMSEYPDVYGGAACLSTHWVGDVNVKGDKIPLAFNQYLINNLPEPKNHKFYFDYGTVGLDSLYKPYQTIIDKTMSKKGYTTKNWITKEFKGDDHSEASWSRRLYIPLEFLLANNNN